MGLHKSWVTHDVVGEHQSGSLQLSATFPLSVNWSKLIVAFRHTFRAVSQTSSGARCRYFC